MPPGSAPRCHEAARVFFSGFMGLSPEALALQEAVAGRLRLIRELGRSDIGIVLLARELALGRLVTVTLLVPALAGEAAARERFLHAAQAAMALAHPHIVPTYDVAAEGGMAWRVGGFVDGESLEAHVHRVGPIATIADVMRMTHEIAWALGYIHAMGLVHGGLTPANVLLERGTNRIGITDIGMAAVPEGADMPHAAASRDDRQADIRALAQVTWFAITGVQTPGPQSTTRSLPPLFAHALERASGTGEPWADMGAWTAEIERARIGTMPAPPAVSAFVRNAESAGDEIGTALTAAILSVIAFRSLLDESVLRAGPIFYTAATLAAGFAVLRFGQVIFNARALLTEGYTGETVRAAILREEAARTEARGGRHPGVRRATWLLLAWGVIKTTASVFLARNDEAWIGILGAASTVVVPTIALRMFWNDLSAGQSGWNRMLAGGLGRLVFRVARVGLRRAPRTY